jgi:hypothetical protein
MARRWAGAKLFNYVSLLYIWVVYHFLNVEGAQKLRPWLGDPSWITGTDPPSRFLNGFVNYKQDLYLYGGAISITGDGIFNFCHVRCCSKKSHVQNHWVTSITSILLHQHGQT